MRPVTMQQRVIKMHVHSHYYCFFFSAQLRQDYLSMSQWLLQLIVERGNLVSMLWFNREYLTYDRFDVVGVHYRCRRLHCGRPA